MIAIVGALLDRLELVALDEARSGLGDESRAARALLAERGLGEETVAEARDLLGRIGVEADSEDDVDALDRAARREAGQHLWRRYLEWSGITRMPIGDRRLLRALGFPAIASPSSTTSPSRIARRQGERKEE